MNSLLVSTCFMVCTFSFIKLNAGPSACLRPARGARGEDPVRGLYEEVRNDYENVYAIGDCRQVRNIQNAIWDAFEVARTL